MKKLILIRGLSGAGKTEHAELIVGDHEDRAEITVDRFFEDDNGTYTFDFTRIKEAYEWCKNGLNSYWKMSTRLWWFITHSLVNGKQSLTLISQKSMAMRFKLSHFMMEA